MITLSLPNLSGREWKYVKEYIDMGKLRSYRRKK